MFERFAASSRRVMVEAQSEARELGHHFISTQHLVLGLLVPDPEENSAVRALLLSAGLDLDRARALVDEAEGRRSSAPIIGTIPFTPRSKKVLEMSLREAVGAGWHEIRPEHLLLGILREGGGSGCRLLHAYGITLEGVRSWIAGPPAGARHITFGGAWLVHPITLGRMTPGGRVAVQNAQVAAGGRFGTVGTQHVLLGLFDERLGLAAAALNALGVTRERVEATLAELDPTGTSDGPPPPRVARVGDGVDVHIDDPELARRLERAADDPAVGEVVRQALLAHFRDGEPPASG